MTDGMRSPSNWQTGRVMRRLGRRNLLRGAAAALSLPAALGAPAIGRAAGTKTITIGMDFALTGAEAEEATVELDGARLAVEEANAKHTVPGYELRTIVLNDATTTAGGYDPAQAATNARIFAENPSVVAVVGPIDSGSAMAMLPILSTAGLPMVAGSTTSPALTSPKFAAQTRQNGVTLVFFRTCGNEAFVEPGMVNFFYGKHNVRSAYILDDGSAGGAGIADAFQAAARKKGIKVFGRDTLNAREADYTTVLTKISGLRPDLLEYGGTSQAGAKLAKQAYDILPRATLRSRRERHLRRGLPESGRFPGRGRLVRDLSRAAHFRHSGWTGVAARIPPAMEQAAQRLRTDDLQCGGRGGRRDRGSRKKRSADKPSERKGRHSSHERTNAAGSNFF